MGINGYLLKDSNTVTVVLKKVIEDKDFKKIHISINNDVDLENFLIENANFLKNVRRF